MAELQTVAAVLDLLKVAYQAGIFLRKVKNASKIAAEISDVVARLSGVLHGVHGVLLEREERCTPSEGPDEQITTRIHDSVNACRVCLENLEHKVDGFDKGDAKKWSENAWKRVQIAFNSHSIQRMKIDLEARISIFNTDLVVLQLYDQTQTKNTIDANHDQLIHILDKLSTKLNYGNKLLEEMLHDRLMSQSCAAEIEDGYCLAEESDSDRGSLPTVDVLRDCLHEAEEIHEKYSSEYQPDCRSIRMQHLMTEQDDSSPFASPGPLTPRATSPQSTAFNSTVDLSTRQPPQGISEVLTREDMWPLDFLSMLIDGHVARARRNREEEHYQSAEKALDQAIRYYEQRETHYAIPFACRVEMEEERALLYQRQGKWGDAVSTVRRLLLQHATTTTPEGPDGAVNLPYVRQNHLLGSIYLERHAADVGKALSETTNDIEQAEKYARRAFNHLFGKPAVHPDHTEMMNSCIQSLVKILESQDKTVEANEMSKFLVPNGSPTLSASIRRFSSIRSQPSDISSDSHTELIRAISAGDNDVIQSLLTTREINLDQPSRSDKTPLMHAVERGDAGILNKLLGMDAGAEVDAVNRRGLTALHYAALTGQHEMAGCLIAHDASIEPKDRKGETPLHKAVMAGDKQMVEIFFNARESSLQVKTRNDEYSLLHHSIKQSSIQMTQLLLDLDPTLKDAVDHAGKSALHHCAAFDYLEQAAALLDHQHTVNVNAVDSVGRTALELVATQPWNTRRDSLVNLLLGHGAQISPGRVQPRMLHYAALSTQMITRHASQTSVTTTESTSRASSRLSRITHFFTATGQRQSIK